MADAHSIILHHYDPSPFSEKVRLGLGIKNISWAGVDIPMMMPKPDLMPLTGGYRKTPVMQIGADIYCDTQLILDELDARVPQPSFNPSAQSQLMGRYCDTTLFRNVVAVIFGTIGDLMPEEFKKDREKLMGGAFNTEEMKAAAPMVLDQLKSVFGWLDQSLADGRDYLEGANPSLADIHAYLCVWFLGNTVPHILDEIAPPSLLAWRDRLAGLRHGTKEVLDAKDALAIAKDATPSVTGDGPAVTVMADDYGKDPVSGILVADTTHRTVIVRDDDQVGQVAVHFPKTGYVVVRG